MIAVGSDSEWRVTAGEEKERASAEVSVGDFEGEIRKMCIGFIWQAAPYR